jgi:hypothetical protein
MWGQGWWSSLTRLVKPRLTLLLLWWRLPWGRWLQSHDGLQSCYLYLCLLNLLLHIGDVLQ